MTLLAVMEVESTSLSSPAPCSLHSRAARRQLEGIFNAVFADQKELGARVKELGMRNFLCTCTSHVCKSPSTASTCARAETAFQREMVDRWWQEQQADWPAAARDTYARLSSQLPSCTAQRLALLFFTAQHISQLPPPPQPQTVPQATQAQVEVKQWSQSKYTWTLDTERDEWGMVPHLIGKGGRGQLAEIQASAGVSISFYKPPKPSASAMFGRFVPVLPRICEIRAETKDAAEAAWVAIGTALLALRHKRDTRDRDFAALLATGARTRAVRRAAVTCAHATARGRRVRASPLVLPGECVDGDDTKLSTILYERRYESPESRRDRRARRKGGKDHGDNHQHGHSQQQKQMKQQQGKGQSGHEAQGGRAHGKASGRRGGHGGKGREPAHHLEPGRNPWRADKVSQAALVQAEVEEGLELMQM